MKSDYKNNKFNRNTNDRKADDILNEKFDSHFNYHNKIRGQKWDVRKPATAIKPRELDYVIIKPGKDMGRVTFNCVVCGCQFAVLHKKCQHSTYAIKADGSDERIAESWYNCPNCGVECHGVNGDTEDI